MSTLREQLQAIYDQAGRLTPGNVVTAAADPEHPLHSRFEWDDAVAGPRFREIQARDLIRSVRVVYREATESEPQRTTRAFVAPRAPDRPHEYLPVTEVAQDPMMRQLVLRQMKRDIVELQRRYGQFEEFWRLLAAAIDESAA